MSYQQEVVYRCVLYFGAPCIHKRAASVCLSVCMSVCLSVTQSRPNETEATPESASSKNSHIRSLKVKKNPNPNPVLFHRHRKESASAIRPAPAMLLHAGRRDEAGGMDLTRGWRNVSHSTLEDVASRSVAQP